LTKMNISADSQVIILLCSNLAIPKGMESEYKPLNLNEWNTLAKKIAASSLKRPEAFLSSNSIEWERELDIGQQELKRIDKLLSRRGSLAIELKRLNDMGIWVLTRSESIYPCRLKKLLKEKALSRLRPARPIC
jgi:DNA processing protein